MREGLLFSQHPMMSYDSIQSAFNSLAPCTDRPVKIECVCMCVCVWRWGWRCGRMSNVRALISFNHFSLWASLTSFSDMEKEWFESHRSFESDQAAFTIACCRRRNNFRWWVVETQRSDERETWCSLFYMGKSPARSARVWLLHLWLAERTFVDR